MQCSSFPPEGVTGTSGYHFEYNLHLIKIPSHLNRESIYNQWNGKWNTSRAVILSHKVYEQISGALLLQSCNPDPHTKSKALVSQDSYGIVFMHRQNVMADISAQSQSFHFGLCAS